MGSCLSNPKNPPTTNGDNAVSYNNSGKPENMNVNGGKTSSFSSGQNTTPSRYTPNPGRPLQEVDASSSAQYAVSHHAIQIAIQHGKKVVRGLYDYVSAEDVPMSDVPDLNFRKGDVMEIIKEDGDWWLARNMLTGAQGYVPNTYVALENSIDRFDWFHGKITRKDAERLLLNPTAVRGTFLIRESESVAGAYSLSLLDIDASRVRAVKHYRIRDLDNGGCYITTKRRCDSLEELVKFYTSQAEGLCYKLTMPCHKDRPVVWDISHSTRDKWEIERSTLVKMELLGSGNFGEVWKGLWNKKTWVAIKTLKEGTMEPAKFLEEAAIMKKLHHQRLVTLFAVCTREEPIFIVTELCTGGSLLSYLRTDAGKTLTTNTLMDIATQVAEGMNYIESLHYIHRDLAARNILVGENNNVKIGDFGLARIINEEVYDATAGAKFPIKWTAPEAAMFGRFTIKSDVWAYGIFLVELVTFGQIPYPGMTNSEVLTQLERGYRHPRPRDCSPELYEIMTLCWKQNPSDRPTFDHLYHTMDDFSVAMEKGYQETNGP